MYYGYATLPVCSETFLRCITKLAVKYDILFPLLLTFVESQFLIFKRHILDLTFKV